MRKLTYIVYATQSMVVCYGMPSQLKHIYTAPKEITQENIHLLYRAQSPGSLGPDMTTQNRADQLFFHSYQRTMV